jgi:hypothetical protein
MAHLRETAFVRRTGRLIARTIRATGTLVRDRRIPRALRWIGAFGLLPIPGPVDEAVLLLLAPVLYLFYREPMRAAWRDASGQGETLRP